MRTVFQIVQTYGIQDIPTVVLTVNAKKYFFNLPEALLRFSAENYVKLSKGSTVFFTRLHTEHFTGILTFLGVLYEENSSYGLKMYGPPGICQAFSRLRLSIGRYMLPCSGYDFFNNKETHLGTMSQEIVKEIRSRGLAGNPILDLNAFLKEQKVTKPKEVNDASDQITSDDIFKDDNVEITPVMLSPPNPQDYKDASLCYICKTNKKNGKVIKERIASIPKKNLKLILESEEVEIEGVTYKSQDYREPDIPPQAFVIIDCPEVSYIDSLASNEKIKALYFDKINSNELELKSIIHMCPIEVLKNEKYRAFIESFDKSCHHIFVNEHVKTKDVAFVDEPINLADFESKEEQKLDTTNSKSEDSKKPGAIIPEEETKSMDSTKKGKKDGKKKKEQPKQQPVQYTNNKNLIPKYRGFEFVRYLSQYFPDNFSKLEPLKGPQEHDLKDLFPSLTNYSTAENLAEFVFYKKSDPLEPMQFLPHNPLKMKQVRLEPEFFKRLEDYKKAKESKEMVDDQVGLFKNCDPEMVFLGTNSLRPWHFRNVSGIFLRFWQQHERGIILDAGTGTYFQLLYHYGEQKTRELLANLEVLFVSHVHQDHVWGFMRVLSERQKVLKEEGIKRDPVFLVIPQCAIALLRNFSKFVEELDVRLVVNQHINRKGDIDSTYFEELKKKESEPPSKVISIFNDISLPEYKDQGLEESYKNLPIFEKELKEKLGITKFRTMDVDHCNEAFAVYFEHEDGWSYLYSGDKRPCDTMMKEFGKVTILVHEATFSIDLHEDILEDFDRHTTDKQAIEAGMQMGAWRTILTHYSGRHDIIIPITEYPDSEEKEYENYKVNSTVFAYDHFRSKLSDLRYCPQISRCIRSLYSESF